MLTLALAVEGFFLEEVFFFLLVFFWGTLDFFPFFFGGPSPGAPQPRGGVWALAGRPAGQGHLNPGVSLGAGRPVGRSHLNSGMCEGVC